MRIFGANIRNSSLMAGVVIFFIVLLGASSTQLVENVPAGEICVIQAPISGERSWYFEPGLKWQGFGKVTSYKREGLETFYSLVDPDDETEHSRYRSAEDKSIKIQFNDSGAGWISGSIRYAYPLTAAEMDEIHKKFQGHENVINGLIKPNIERVINMTGPLMSSIESSRTRRAEIPFYIEDQIQNGLYLTVTRDTKTRDEFTGEETTTKIAEILLDENGKPRRQSPSIVSELGMRVYNININKINYESKVLARLNDLFKADSEKQISYMKANKAEQDAKTAEQEGIARAKTAEWAAKEITATETENANKIKQVAVIEAERNKEVAILDKQTAALYAEALNLRTAADAKRKRELFLADGALDAKRETYENVMSKAFDMIGKYEGAWVPQLVMGGSSASGNNAAMDMVNLLMVKTAKDLGLDLNMDIKKQ